MADLALISHLMRRDGFGATRDELEALSANSYEYLVEDLLHPERSSDHRWRRLRRRPVHLARCHHPRLSGQPVYIRRSPTLHYGA